MNGIKKEVEDDTNVQIKQENKTTDNVKNDIKKESGSEDMITWYDLDPDDTDEELENLTGPPNIMARSPSPNLDLFIPIAIKPKPSQSITISDLENLDKESIFKYK